MRSSGLQQQQVENQAKAKEISAKNVKWDVERKKHDDTLRCLWSPLKQQGT